jgi:hypothetical protein
VQSATAQQEGGLATRNEEDHCCFCFTFVLTAYSETQLSQVVEANVLVVGFKSDGVTLGTDAPNTSCDFDNPCATVAYAAGLAIDQDTIIVTAGVFQFPVGTEWLPEAAVGSKTLTIIGILIFSHFCISRCC